MRPEKGWFLRPSLVASQVGGRNLSLWFDKLTTQLDKHIKNRVCRLCSIIERPHGGRTRQETPPHQPSPARGGGQSNVLPKISDYLQTGKPNAANA